MRTLLLAFLCCFSLSTWAIRLLPMNIQMGMVNATQANHEITFTKKNHTLGQAMAAMLRRPEQLVLAPVLLILDEQNRSLLRSQLNTLQKKIVGITLNHHGQINRIWVLTPAEIQLLQQRGH